MSKSAPSPQTVLITGASEGIGHALAQVFAENGYNLVLVARNAERLQQITAQLSDQHGVWALALPRDLSIADSPTKLHAELKNRDVTVNILVNNAAFATQGMFAESDLATQLQLLQLNIVTTTHLTRLMLPEMIERKFGRVLNVSSMAAYMPGPLMSTYFASKSYVLSFSQALCNELHGSGVTVTALCPGPTRTKFPDRAGLNGCKAFRSGVMDADAVARIGYKATIRGKSLCVPGIRNRLRLLPLAFVPQGVLAHFARVYHEVEDDSSP